MDRNTAFILIFFVALIATVFFLGTSLTAYVVETMHCENNDCHKICRFDSDCSSNEACCNNVGVGICLEECVVPYEFSPGISGVDERFPFNEKPKIVDVNVIVFYCLILVALVLLGVLYLTAGKLHKKKKGSKVKRKLSRKRR